ncbi:choline/ethanolamine transporter FLVCR1-like [Clavelina lepadiformis]|uniref:choline/ethanolamine transporter FLVCR1-like n=1 Tax=Clavelina lepadiformis TaxID=159417 RepID=UPI0040438696
MYKMTEIVELQERQHLLSNENLQVQATSLRWLVLLILMLLTMFVSFEKVSFGQVSDVYVAYFEVSNALMDWAFVGIKVGKIIACPILAYFISANYLSLQRLTFAAFASLTGACVCVIVSLVNSASFAILAVGQVGIAVAALVVITYPAMLSPVWFKSREVGTAIGAFEASIGAGLSLGFVLPSYLFDHGVSKCGRQGNTSSSLNLKLQLHCDARVAKYMYLGLLGATVLLFTLALVFVKDEPTYPPTLSQAYKRIQKDPTKDWSFSNYICQCKQLLTDITFVALCSAFGVAIYIGHIEFILMLPVVHKILAAAEYDVTTHVISGYVMVAYAVGILLGSVVGGALVNMHKRLRLQAQVGILVELLATVGLTLSYKFDQLVALIVCNFLFGFFSRFSAVAFYEMTTQHTYPINEAFVSIWMTWIRVVTETVCLLIARVLFDNTGALSTPVIMAVSLFLALICISIIQPVNKRWDMEERLGHPTTHSEENSATN